MNFNLALTWQFAADIATRSFKVTLAAEHFNLGNVNGNFKLVVEGAGGRVRCDRYPGAAHRSHRLSDTGVVPRSVRSQNRGA